MKTKKKKILERKSNSGRGPTAEMNLEYLKNNQKTTGTSHRIGLSRTRQIQVRYGFISQGKSLGFILKPMGNH